MTHQEGSTMNRAEPLTYTVDEVAELLGIARGVAYECVRNGSIPATRGASLARSAKAVPCLAGRLRDGLDGRTWECLKGLVDKTPRVVTARTSATPPARSGSRVVPAVRTSTVDGQPRTKPRTSAVPPTGCIQVGGPDT
jgi:hypothetical protein